MNEPNENEVKISLASRSALEAKLREAHFRISIPREHEVNDLFDTPGQALRHKEMLLRLRQVDTRSVLTWKGPGEPGPHKNRQELETNIGSLDTVRQIFTQLGFGKVFRYEKYRTEYTDRGGRGVVTVDETPIGDFLEIEGPAEWIDSTARELGFTQQDYILDSYGQLYLQHCEKNGIQPADMLFESQSSRQAN